MYRRALLVGVAGLSGCTGLLDFGQRDRSSGGPPEGVRTLEPTEAPGDGSDSSPTPDGDESDGLSQEQLRKLPVEELLTRGRTEITRSVEAYAGSDGRLRSVSAASDDFDPAEVIEHLYRARAAAEAADRQGISADQQSTIARLGRLESLIRLFIDVQVLLIEVHADVEELAIAVEFVDPETVGSLVDRVDSRHERLQGLIARASQSRYAQSVDVAERPTADEYEAKLQQVRAETTAVGRLVDAMPRVVKGVRLLAEARGQRDSGSPYAAADTARDAESAFRRGANELDSVASAITTPGRAFTPVTNDLYDAVVRAREQSRELYVGIS